MPDDAERDAVNPKPGVNTEHAASRLDIASRRKQVATMLHNRIPQRNIAAALNVSPATVSNDLKSIRVGWMEEANHSLELHVARQLNAYDEDERYWRGQMVANRGDVELCIKIYNTILGITDRRRKLLGMDAPVRLDLARSEARRMAAEYGLDEKELLQLAEDIISGKV